jgi:hypothetical protein
MQNNNKRTLLLEKLRVKVVGATTLSIKTLRKMTFSIMTLSIKKFSITINNM